MSSLSNFINSPSGASGYSGTRGSSAYSGATSKSGYSGTAGTSAYSGTSGRSGYAGTSSATLDITVTAGEALAARDYVFVAAYTNLELTAGRAFKANQSVPRYASYGWYTGFAVDAINSGATGSVRIMGVLGGFSSLTAGAPQYLSATAGAITETKQATDSLLVGIALSTTEVLVNCMGDQTVAVDTATKGFWTGGHTSNTVATSATEKTLFSSDTTASCTTANMSTAKQGIASVGDYGIKGFFCGGATLPTGYVVTVDKITYSTDIGSSVTSANISKARSNMGSVSERLTKGYLAGGYTGDPVATGEKLTFSSETTAASTSSNLSSSRYSLAGIYGGATKGYFGGGWTVAPVSTTDTVVFSTDITSATTTANLSVARGTIAAISEGSTKGYFCGGITNPGNSAVSDKLTFSNDTTAASTSSNLAVAKNWVVGLSCDSTRGFIAGGSTAASTWSNTAEKITYSSDVLSSATTANLILARSIHASISEVGL